MLDGYGPIPASMARDLVANGADSFYRVLVTRGTGRRWRSAGPATGSPRRCGNGCGCGTASVPSRAVPTTPWTTKRTTSSPGHKGGTTGISNLGQPCPKHHRLRHTSAWKPTPATKNEPPGWISPSGRRYKSEHQDWEPPHWPHQLKPNEGRIEGRITARSPGQTPVRAPGLRPHRAIPGRRRAWNGSSTPSPDGHSRGTHAPDPRRASPARSPAPKSNCPLFSSCISCVGSSTWSRPRTCASSCMTMARTSREPSERARISVRPGASSVTWPATKT